MCVSVYVFVCLCVCVCVFVCTVVVVPVCNNEFSVIFFFGVNLFHIF